MPRFLFVLVLIVATLLAIMVSAMNATSVAIELAFARITSPLGVALIVTFVIGLLVGSSWRLHWISQLLRERGQLRRALRIAEDRARATMTDGKGSIG